MRSLVVYISPAPGHAAAPAVEGLKAFRDQHRLAWDVALLAPHDRSLLQHADWVVARIGHDFDYLNDTIAPAQRVMLVPYQRRQQAYPVACAFEQHRFGWLAAQHAAERGYRHTVTITSGWSVHQARNLGFAAACEQLGVSHHSYTNPPQMPVADAEPRLFAWLASQPRPFLIYRPVDDQATWLRDQLLGRGYAIPGDVALIGTGNHIICNYREPALTSVAYPWRQMGEAAGYHILHRERGNPTPPQVELVPTQVIARASTHAAPVADALVRRAVRWLERHLAHPRPAEAAAAYVGCSTATLTRRFRAGLGSTPKQVHDRLRIERAEVLLVNPSLSLAQVAERAGFSGTTAFGVAFKRRRRVSPSDWRRTANATP